MARKSQLVKNQKRTPFALGAFVLLTIYALLLVVPLIWCVYSSFKNTRDFNTNPFGWFDPAKGGFSPQNYAEAFKEMYLVVRKGTVSRRVLIPEMFLNSLIWAVGSSFVLEASRMCCAYVVAKFRFKHRWVRHVHTLVIFLMIVSFPSNLAVGIEFNKLCGLYDNMFLKILSAITFGGAHFLYFYAGFVGVSNEYSEAAEIDGAGQFRIMLRINIPMVKNIFLALFVLTFIGEWNNYTISYVFLPSSPTIAHALFSVQNGLAVGKVAASVPHKLCACTLVILPTLLLFIIFKDKMIGNISIGGLKG